jgi:hypothetical protein
MTLYTSFFAREAALDLVGHIVRSAVEPGPDCWVIDADGSNRDLFWFVPVIGHPDNPEALAYTQAHFAADAVPRASVVGVFSSRGRHAALLYIAERLDALERFGFTDAWLTREAA